MFSAAMPEHTDYKAGAKPTAANAHTPEADMDNFSAGQAHDANFEHGALIGMADPFDLHADDNLGDEAPFPSTWQVLASGDVPND